MKKYMVLGVLFYMLFIGLPVFAACPDGSDCPDVTTSSDIYNEVYYNHGDTVSGGYSNASGSMTVNSSGTKVSEIAGEIIATSLGDVAENDNNSVLANGKAVLNFVADTIQKDYGQASLSNGMGAVEEGSWASQSKDQYYGWGGQNASAVVTDATKAVNGETMNFNLNLATEGKVSVDYTQTATPEMEQRQVRVITSEMAQAAHNGDAGQTKTAAAVSHVFGGGTNLGPVQAQFAGAGNGTGTGPINGIGTGVATITQVHKPNGESINSTVRVSSRINN